MKSYDGYIAYDMSHMWVIVVFFKKWVIAHYSRMEQNFEIPNPADESEFYEEFDGDKENCCLSAQKKVIKCHSIWISILKLQCTT